MLETHLNSPITQRRLRTGAAAGHIDAFADWLYRQGYKPSSIDNLLTSLAGWTDWMLAAGFTAQDPVAALGACKLAIEKRPRVRYSRGPNHQSVTAASGHPAIRTGIMRSLTSLSCRADGHFGVEAVHNRALRIIGERADHLHHHPTRAGVVVSTASVRLRKPAFLSRTRSIIVSTSRSERDRRSSFQTTSTSPLRS